jgi:outer membrane immunogenic protein
MMKKVLIAGIGLLSAVVVMEPSVPASADEDIARPRRERAAPRRAQPRPVAQPRQVAQSSNWSGGQLGGSNGASSVNNTFVEPGAYICPSPTVFGSDCFETLFSFSDRKWSYTVGAFAGWRWQFGMTVVGVEADVAWKNAESSSSLASTTFFDVCCDLYRTDAKTGSVQQTWDASFRGRFGILATPWTLLYVTAGVAFGEIKGSFTYRGVAYEACPSSPCSDFVIGTATAAGSWSDVRAGGTVGGGVETELWQGVKGRFEYRYTDFGTSTKNLPVHTDCSACDSPSSNVTIDVKNNFHTFRVGLGIDL